MPLDLKNEQTVKDCKEYAHNEMFSYFNSGMYQKMWRRFYNRQDAYHRINKTNENFKSRIYLASYFNGVEALRSQFMSTYSNDPLCFIDSIDNSNIDPEAQEKSLIAHFDINYQLEVTRFRAELYNNLDHLLKNGVCCFRTFLRSDAKKKEVKKVNTDMYGINNGISIEQQIERKEFSIDEIVHPLNFAHEINKSDFPKASWAGVRYELPVYDLHRLLRSKRGYIPGIKRILNRIESENGTKGINVSQDSFYSSNGDSFNSNSQKIICFEYSGMLNIKGNYFDDNRYIIIYSPEYDEVIWINNNPYDKHPYWKMKCYATPDSPICVDPCSTLLPINEMENTTVNQFFDYMNTGLKALYEVIPGNIIGGIESLLRGFPNGFIPLNKNVNLSQSIAPINIGKQSIPSVSEAMSWIQSFKQEYGPSSNLRGKGSEVKNADTATGISLLANREDTIIQTMIDTMNIGLKDGIMLKIQMNKYMNEPKIAGIKYKDENAFTRVQYYPYEIADQDYSFKINVEKSDTRAGKYMSYIKLVTGLDQLLAAKGVNVPADFIIDSLRDVGQALNIDNIDERMKQLKQSAQQQIPQLGMQQQQMQPNLQQQPMQPQPQTGDLNAQMAMA